MKSTGQSDRMRRYLFEMVVDGMVSKNMAAPEAAVSRRGAAIILWEAVIRLRLAAGHPRWSEVQRDRLRPHLARVQRSGGGTSELSRLRGLLSELGEPDAFGSDDE